MIYIDIEQIPNDWSDLMHSVEEGESVIFMRNNQPVAELKRLALRPIGLAEGDFIVPKEFDSPLPDESLADWVETHDTSSLLDSLTDANETFEVVRTPMPTRVVDLRLRDDHLQAILTFAERNGLPYQTVMRDWLLERLQHEAPDLAPTS